MSFDDDAEWRAAGDEPTRRRSDPGAAPQYPEAPEPKPAHGKRNILIGAGAMVAVAAGIGIGIGVSGSHGSTVTPVSSSSDATIVLSGTLTIPFAGTDLFDPQAVDPDQTGTAGPGYGDPCQASGGFTDISQGAAVTIGDSAGKTLAVTPLDAGTVIGDAGQPASCEFDFQAKVPNGLNDYTVTIGHRGTQVFTLAQVGGNEVALTLGD